MFFVSSPEKFYFYKNFISPQKSFIQAIFWYDETSMTQTSKKHIIIAGVGFGGLHAYQTLTKELQPEDGVEVTLINRGDAFVFVPMIHEVGSGLLQPDAITQPIRLLPKTYLRDFIDGTIVGIDADAQTVTVERAEGFVDTQHYDFLVLGIGSQTNYMGVAGAAEHAFPLRTLDDARRLKNHVLECFDKADAETDPATQEALVRFVVVGGGATGVEIAGELSDLLCDEMAHAFPRLRERGKVVLVDRGEELVKEAGPWMSHRTRRLLEDRGCVEVRMGMRVESVSPEGVVCNGEMLPSKTVIWCAGVSAASVPITAEKSITYDERSKRIVTQENLSLAEYDNVFVIGDVAQVMNKEEGRPYGMRAQYATEQGKTAARNILARIRGGVQEVFSWKERGTIISLGKHGALADISGARLSGFAARLVYRVAYLSSIVGVRAKFRTALEWFLNVFVSRDISRL